MARIAHSVCFWFVLMIATASSGLFATERKDNALTLGYGSWPPFTNQNLQHKGILAFLANEALSLHDYQIKFVQAPWDVVREGLRDGSVDISIGWLKNAERESELLFSDPIMYTTNVWFHHSDLDFSWEHLSDLSGFRIGLTEGYSYGEELDQADYLNTSRATSDSENLLRLLRKEIDLFPIDRMVGQHLLESQLPFQVDKLRYDEKPLLEEPLHVVVSKTHPQAKQLIEAFNEGLRQLKLAGKYEQALTDLNSALSIGRMQLYTEEYAPYSFLTDTENPSGIAVEIFNRLAELIGAKKQVMARDFYPWARAYREIQRASNSAIFAITHTPKRDALFKWVGPIVRSRVVLLSVNQPKFMNRAPETLQGVKICVIRDDVGEELLLSRNVDSELLHYVNHPRACAKLMKLGRVQLWAYGSHSAQWYLQEAGMTKEDFQVSYVLKESAQYIAFNRHVSDEVVGRFDEALNYLRLSGELKTILSKYGLESDLPQVRPQR